MATYNTPSRSSVNGLGVSQKRKSKNHFVFVICILIAAFFWLLIKLSYQYNESFNFKVSYYNAPNEKMLTKVIDTNVNVTIEAKGFQMLKLILTEDLTKLDIDLNNFDIIHLKGKVYYITTNAVKDKIGEYIRIPDKDVILSGQRLEFQMEDLLEKKVAVVNRVNFNFLPQYNLYSKVLISPSEVNVFGPQEILDTLQYIYTDNNSIINISKNIDENVKLINPNTSFLNLSVDNVNIKANVEKFTESSLETLIDLSNINYEIKAFPNSVNIFFTIAQKDFSNISQTQFKVEANLKNTDILTSKKLQLKVVEKPDFVSGIRLQPSEIEFLILK